MLRVLRVRLRRLIRSLRVAVAVLDFQAWRLWLYRAGPYSGPLCQRRRLFFFPALLAGVLGWYGSAEACGLTLAARRGVL